MNIIELETPRKQLLKILSNRTPFTLGDSNPNRPEIASVINDLKNLQHLLEEGVEQDACVSYAQLLLENRPTSANNLRETALELLQTGDAEVKV